MAAPSTRIVPPSGPIVAVTGPSSFFIVWQDDRQAKWEIYGQAVINSLLVGKAIDFVVEHANVTEVDPPPADEAPAAPAPDSAEEPTTTESDE